MKWPNGRLASYLAIAATCSLPTSAFAGAVASNSVYAPAPVPLPGPVPKPGGLPVAGAPTDPIDDPLGDCLEVPSGVCLAGASGTPGVVVTPAYTPGDMVLWYQFDKSLPVDDSGNKHHLLDEKNSLTPMPVGPGVLSRGASAAFDGHGAVKRRVPRFDELETDSFTIALWLYLLEDSVGGWRTIFNKAADPQQMAPALLLRPDERRLQVRVSPTAESGSLDAVGLLPMRRWTHIAVTYTGNVLRLFINGLKDAEVILELGVSPTAGTGDLHIGGDPWRAGVKAFMDDFRWYSRGLSQTEIRALNFPSLTGMGSEFIRMGCTSCKFSEAVDKCGQKAHLCSVQELFAGGLHIARSMGWLAGSPEVWYHGDEGEDRFNGKMKLGLCCAN
eukprot:TRINITY_DN111286_c0_g1_i1.p1 TRINITY_DN111286_c0_g1~~TRINITY_DN111286_c0_g1_i1.p1  ORF type:complete len:388 (-),score=67.66 TRINITY_DN111286_c0_g1_i1:86-1249(-)